MEVCSDQDDKAVVTLHSNLRLLDNSIGYDNVGSIDCKPYGHFEECVDRIHNSCQLPDEGKSGMSTFNKDGTIVSADDTIDVQSSLSGDQEFSPCLLNTDMSSDESADVCTDRVAIDGATVGQLHSFPSSESTLGNTVEISQHDSLSTIFDVSVPYEADKDDIDKNVNVPGSSDSMAQRAIDVLVVEKPVSVESNTMQIEQSTLKEISLPEMNSSSLNTDAVNVPVDGDTSDAVVDPSSVELEDASCLDEQGQHQLNDDEGRKKGYRVRFHENHVVSGYLEPALPWRDVSLCSTVELVSAYRNACTLMAVKPSNKVLQQLEGIGSFEERHELLSLRGENIDIKLCETLEEVFRRVRFRSIDIEATGLDEDSAVTMFDLLDYYEACQRLNISFNKNLGIRGWQACARFIRKTASLEVLEARGCSFNDPAMTIVGRSLRLGSVVKSLHLENCFLSGRPLMLLVAAVKFNEVLRELFLADNKLTPTDGIQLGSLLKTNRTLSLLDIRNNLIQDVGMHHICDGLWEQTTPVGLNTLVVWNNQITYESMGYVARALTNVVNLETINIGHNNITNEGIHRLKEGLLQNKSLLRIGLQSAKISCEGAVALAEFVAESYKLLRLDLRGNYIRTGGLMALTLSLKVNQSVTRLDLDQEAKKEPGMRDYVEQQKRLLSDIALYTARNLSILAGTASSSNGDGGLHAPDVPSSSASRPTLTLPTGFVTPSESLESPAYVPLSDPITSTVANPVIDGDLVSGPLSPDWADAQSIYNKINMASPSDERCPPLIFTSTETNDSVTSSVEENSESGGDIPTPPSSLPTPAVESKTSKFAATVRRKFTVSKATLPSPTVTSKPLVNKSENTAPVVVFTKMTSPTDDSGDDDTARVCFQAESSSRDVDGVESHADVLNSTENQVDADSTMATTDVLRESDDSNIADKVQAIFDVDPTSSTETSNGNSELANSSKTVSVNNGESIEIIQQNVAAGSLTTVDDVSGLSSETGCSKTVTEDGCESLETSQEAAQPMDIQCDALQEALVEEDNELLQLQSNLGPDSDSRREIDCQFLVAQTGALDSLQSSQETNVTVDAIVLKDEIALDAHNGVMPKSDVNSLVFGTAVADQDLVEQVVSEDQRDRESYDEMETADVNQ